MKGNRMSSTMPQFFTCPISLDLFRDPVTLCTGQTYERSSIEKWLAAGNLTCPVTMQKLRDPTIVPNHTLRHLINQWLMMGPGFHPGYLTTIDSLASLKHDLESKETSLCDKQRALEKLHGQLTSSSVNLELGFLPLLLDLLFQKATPINFTQEYINFVETALSCVLTTLALGELQPLNSLKRGSRAETFADLLERGTIVIKSRLCQIVGFTSSSLATIDVCASFGESKRVIKAIIDLLHHHNSVSDASHTAINAISALCSLEANREKLIKEGVMEGLVSCILRTEKTEKSLAAGAVARVEQLLAEGGGKEALMGCKDGVKALAEMVFRVSDEEGSENAINALLLVCGDSSEAREDAIGSGVVWQVLLLLQSQCDSSTKNKARMLLKLLRAR